MGARRRTSFTQYLQPAPGVGAAARR
jgi:hypothetical protein